MSAIGIAVIDGGRITNEFFSYVNPETYFDYYNTVLTGINEKTVASAPAFPELWQKIEPLMNSGILAAHNAVFDLSVLKRCLQGYGIYWKNSAKYCCTVQMGKRIVPDISHKLDAMCDYYGIPLNHHQADSDARACAEILLRYMASGADEKNFIRTYTFV